MVPLINVYWLVIHIYIFGVSNRRVVWKLYI